VNFEPGLPPFQTCGLAGKIFHSLTKVTGTRGTCPSMAILNGAFLNGNIFGGLSGIIASG
jgi:hypothetical protein